MKIRNRRYSARPTRPRPTTRKTIASSWRERSGSLTAVYQRRRTPAGSATPDPRLACRSHAYSSVLGRIDRSRPDLVSKERFRDSSRRWVDDGGGHGHRVPATPDGRGFG